MFFSIVQVIVSDSLLNSQIVCHILSTSTYKTYQIIDLVLFIYCTIVAGVATLGVVNACGSLGC